MPIDPKGTKPGVVPAQPAPQTVNMKCKKANCTSISATIVDIGQSPVRMYRCTECGNMWGINVGGAINI
jgi:DNA-directed RNA polymerase subunit M/transcription elongation factor TFIIS